jgi:hypothetical protein
MLTLLRRGWRFAASGLWLVEIEGNLRLVVDHLSYTGEYLSACVRVGCDDGKFG